MTMGGRFGRCRRLQPALGGGLLTSPTNRPQVSLRRGTMHSGETCGPLGKVSGDPRTASQELWLEVGVRL